MYPSTLPLPPSLPPSQVHHSMDESHQEIARLKAEKELYEENMKKAAFMRGVCALNLEAMTMFRQHDSPDGPPPPAHTNGPP